LPGRALTVAEGTPRSAAFGRRPDSVARQGHIPRMPDPTKLTLDVIEVGLELGDAQAARGESVPLEPVLQRLRES